MIPVWALWGGGGTLAYLLYEKLVKHEAHPFTSTTTLPGRVRAKALQLIKTSQNPTQLRTVATALAAKGDTQGAAAANNKAAAIEQQQAPFARTISEAGATGIPSSITIPSITVSTSSPAAAVVAQKYTVASGDNPSSIAKRFGVTLFQLANANPSKKTRIVQGKIFVSEILALPVTAIDSGPASHAKGAAA